MIQQPTRRSVLTGLGALICAPAIVRASSLMPVRAWTEDYAPELWAGVKPVWTPTPGFTLSAARIAKFKGDIFRTFAYPDDPYAGNALSLIVP